MAGGVLMERKGERREEDGDTAMGGGDYYMMMMGRDGMDWDGPWSEWGVGGEVHDCRSRRVSGGMERISGIVDMMWELFPRGRVSFFSFRGRL